MLFQPGYVGVSAVVATSDAFFSFVVALLHMNGVNNGTTFTDVKSHTFTASGDAKTITSQSKFGGASANFDGTGDFISSADHADWNFASGDFTIEFFARVDLGHDNGIISKRTNTTEGWAIECRATGAVWLRAKVGGVWSDTKIATATGLVTSNTWVHVALTRSGSSWVIWIDGVSRGTLTDSGALDNPAQALNIGRSATNGEDSTTGQIDELRITKGYARYSSTFTPPTQEFFDA